MPELESFTPVDYLIIGHISEDITPQGKVPGGTVSYSALTAKANGLKVGIVTSCRSDLNLDLFEGIEIARKNSPRTTTFENIQTPNGRIQYVHGVADTITLEDIPSAWRSTPIIHLGPIVHEISPEIVQAFPDSIIGITPQGWLREWDQNGKVSFCEWPEAEKVLSHSDIAVMSIEDVRGNEELISEYASLLPILVVTEGAVGARIYWNGDVRTVRPPKVNEVDPVGAGDIFATSFFIRYFATRDPWESARYATLVAANSVTRKTLSGVPTPAEIIPFMTQVIEQINL